VNITDVEFVNFLKQNEEESEDMLMMIFRKQMDLMETYHKIEASNGCLITPDVPVDLHSHLGQHRLKDFAWRITEELGEAMNCLKCKPWKVTPMATDVQHYKEEIADAFHFFVELCILSGISPEDLFNIYMRKNEVNQFRQRSEY
jgi:dimeric dUTPase (all-alpha-NTP-PPase superfamily)